jgi:hypothetical protein
VNPASREESRIFYQSIYQAAENVPSGWNGNVAAGVEGTTTTAFKDSVFLRVNYFRAMAGVSGNVVNEPAFSADSQKAALMMTSNNALSHSPPETWLNYSLAGATAADKSNIGLGYFGTQAIDRYIEDAGSTNTAVGHRRWILLPQTTRMGTGDIPANGSFQAANALWVHDEATFSNPFPQVRDTFVAWPPKGYVPYSLVFPRWSFSYPSADFSGASVNLVRNGSAVPVTQALFSNGTGVSRLVFVPDNLNPNNWSAPAAPATDVTTTVNVSNVLIGGVPQDFSYNVTSFDPARDGTDTVAPVISGAANPIPGAPHIYSVNELTLATGYQWKISPLTPYSGVDGAEAAGTVTAFVPAGYNFHDPIVRATGTYSYHLAHPSYKPARFVLPATLVPSGSSALHFKSLLGYATSDQVAKVQISTDGGATWKSIWAQGGNGGAGEATFQQRSIPLAPYEGQAIQVQFLYDFSAGSAYPQTSDGIGWYVDDISFSGTQQLGASTTGTINVSREYIFTPPAVGSYGLQVRPQVYGNYLLAWSRITTLAATLDGNPPPPPQPPQPPAVVTRNIQLDGVLSFGLRKLKSKTVRPFTIRNTGNAPLTVSGITYPRGFSGHWAGTLAPGASASVAVTFNPTRRVTYTGNLNVLSNATSGAATRAVSGKGR